MKNLGFIVPLVVLFAFCTLPFVCLGLLSVVYNKDVAFGVFLLVLGVALPLLGGYHRHKYNK